MFIDPLRSAPQHSTPRDKHTQCLKARDVNTVDPVLGQHQSAKFRQANLEQVGQQVEGHLLRRHEQATDSRYVISLSLRGGPGQRLMVDLDDSTRDCEDLRERGLDNPCSTLVLRAYNFERSLLPCVAGGYCPEVHRGESLRHGQLFVPGALRL